MWQGGTPRPVGNLEMEPHPSAPPMHTPPAGSRFSALAARLRAPSRLARPWRALVVAALALATLVPPAPAPPAVAAGRPHGPLVPDSGLYVGGHTQNIDGHGQQRAPQALNHPEPP